MNQPASTPPSGAPERPKIIYVMGAGRSGSTILGVTLGNCAGVFYAGELDAWLPRSGQPQLSGAERERFWTAVRDDVDGSAADLFGYEAQRYLERSLAPFHIRSWRERGRLRGRYRRVAEDLYHAVARTAGVGNLVDTSHYPLRARELQALGGIDLYIIYLARDPHSVVSSFKRRDVVQYRKSPLRTNVYLWLTNLLAVGVFLRQPRERRLFLRYERFVEDPEAIVRQILGWVGVSSGVPDLTSLQTGIPFQGNRLIGSDVLALESEPPPRRRGPGLTTLLQLPWTAVLSRLRPAAHRRSTAGR
jgi:hypothetical protein